MFVVVVLVVLVMWQFWAPIVLAILLAMLATPAFRWLTSKGLRPSIAAILVVIGTFLIVVIPVAGLLFLVITEGASVIRGAAEHLDEGALATLVDSAFVQSILGRLESALPPETMENFDLLDRLREAANSSVDRLAKGGLSVFGGLFKVISDFFILLFLLFFLVRDGGKMADGFRELLPLPKPQTDRLFDKVHDVTFAVVFGTLGVAGLQGLLGGIGFWIIGLPGLVWGQAIFFSIWAVALVGGVDNYLRPFLMGGQANMSPFYIFLAVIGGIATFGIFGLIFGPLIIAIAIVVVEIYRDEYTTPD